MDWELYERYRSTLLLAGLLLVSTLFLAFQKTTPVQYLRSFLVRFTMIPERIYLSHVNEEKFAPPAAAPASSSEETGLETPAAVDSTLAESRRKAFLLNEENQRLRDLLALRRVKWPRSLVAHVVGRDPQRWFQEIILDKGKEEGLEVDFPVLSVVGDRDALVGRIVEVSAHVSKVMLLQDSLSAVAATVVGDRGEDGVVEGTNAHVLVLKFLDRGSQVKVGDLVMTSGLGKAFPPGVPIGWVEEIEPDPRQLFLQARLRPAVKSNQLRVVLVLAP